MNHFPPEILGPYFKLVFRRLVFLLSINLSSTLMLQVLVCLFQIQSILANTPLFMTLGPV